MKQVNRKMIIIGFVLYLVEVAPLTIFSPKSEVDSEAIIGDVPVMVSIVNQIWRLDLQHI